jgi:hypothetical protein
MYNKGGFRGPSPSNSIITDSTFTQAKAPPVGIVCACPSRPGRCSSTFSLPLEAFLLIESVLARDKVVHRASLSDNEGIVITRRHKQGKATRKRPSFSSCFHDREMSLWKYLVSERRQQYRGACARAMGWHLGSRF